MYGICEGEKVLQWKIMLIQYKKCPYITTTFKCSIQKLTPHLADEQKK